VQVFDKIAVCWIVVLGASFFWDRLERRRLHRTLRLLCGDLVDMLPTFILGRWVFGSWLLDVGDWRLYQAKESRLSFGNGHLSEHMSSCPAISWSCSACSGADGSRLLVQCIATQAVAGSVERPFWPGVTAREQAAAIHWEPASPRNEQALEPACGGKASGVVSQPDDTP
jgi:hypothetical protein